MVNAQDSELEDVYLSEEEETTLHAAFQHSSWQVCLLTLDTDPVRAKARTAELQASVIHKEAYIADGEVLLPVMLHI